MPASVNPEQKSVGPRPIDHTAAHGQGFIVISVVESAYALGMFEINAPIAEIFHGSGDRIVVVRIVLKGTHFEVPSRLPSAIPVECALMRVE